MAPKDTINIYYCRDLICGRKKTIKNDRVKRIHIPQYPSLSVQNICNFLMDHQHVADWLPPLREIPKLPKEYLGNVAYTILGDVFSDWVKE